MQRGVFDFRKKPGLLLVGSPIRPWEHRRIQENEVFSPLSGIYPGCSLRPYLRQKTEVCALRMSDLISLRNFTL